MDDGVTPVERVCGHGAFVDHSELVRRCFFLFLRVLILNEAGGLSG